MEDYTVKVLLVDDDQGDFEMTRAMLSQAEHGSFSLEWVSTFEEAIDAFRSRDHDVYLVDYFLEDRTGLDLLAEAQRQGVREPVIMLTGRGNRRVDVEAMTAGAADYLVKGEIDPERLERSIRYALDRSRSAWALQESEERHRSMFHHLPLGLYRIHPDGTVFDANSALLQILGNPDAETLQRQFASSLFVHPEDRGRVWNLLEREGVVRGFESSIRRTDGATVRVRSTVRLHRGTQQGAILYVEGTLEDITAEKKAEELWGSEARFRTVFRESNTGIALADLSGAILEANTAFAHIFGRRAAEMEGLRLQDLLSSNDQPAVVREMEILLQGEEGTLTAQRRFQGQDGNDVWARFSLSLIRDRERDPEHFMVLLDQVTGERLEG